MVLEPGEKIHVMVRRNFETDVRRHFMGEVVAVTECVARVKGYAAVYNPQEGGYEVKPGARTRILSLVDAQNIINVIPPETNIENTRYVLTADRRLVVTDGEGFSLDINEFGPDR